MRLANISNGLAFPHDGTCNFQSNWGHKCGLGYFRIDSMPYDAIIKLLKGETLTIVDATRRHKMLTDAQKYGVATWCIVFNRAIGMKNLTVCDWHTKEMHNVAMGQTHKPHITMIRKLIKLYGFVSPAIIGENIKLECHKGFIADDKPRRLKEILA